MESHPTISDCLPIAIMTGKVEVKPDIVSFFDHQISFADESLEEIDTVIFATGYEYKFPFLDPTIINLKDNQPFLYEKMYPPRLPFPTFAVIGLIQVIGSIIPVVEMQSRVFTQTLKGLSNLPSNVYMVWKIKKQVKTKSNLYYKSTRHTIQEFWVDYMDRLSTMIGVKPCLLKMLFSSPALALICWFGPCFPAQYRLQGPGTWSGAENDIRNRFKRYLFTEKRHAETFVQNDENVYENASDLKHIQNSHEHKESIYGISGFYRKAMAVAILMVILYKCVSVF